MLECRDAHQDSEVTVEQRSTSPEFIAQAAASVGVELNDGQCGIIATHLEMVLATRSQLNLISESTAQDSLRLHVADSLAAAPEVQGAQSILDIGSGAGYPGIPLAAASMARVTLVESRAKRARFLEAVLERLRPLGFSGAVVNERAESNAAIDSVGSVDAVVARALAPLPTIVELAAPFLSQGGRLIAFKGNIESAELERGDSAGEMVGLGERSLREFRLPGRGEHRQLVVYRRTGEPTIELPRREGRATKSPLA